MPEAEDNLPKNVSAAEAEAAHAVAAPFINKTIISIGGTPGSQMARVTFLELPALNVSATQPIARAAVTMTVSELLQLRDLINSFNIQVMEVPIKPGDG